MDTEIIEQPSTELTVQARAAIALASDKIRQDLIAMAAKSTHLVEVKNKAARDEIHSAAMALASARIAISKTGKAARDDATKFSKAIIAEEASLIAITEPEEKRLLSLRDGWDAVIAAEKAAREAAEKARIMAITERIAGIRQYVELAASCRTAARIHELQEKLVRISLDGFEEFADEAAAAHADAMKRVEALLVEKHIAEQEQERIKAEQAAAAAKLAAERAEFAAAQAAAKAEADRAAKEIADARAAHEAEVLRATQASRDAAIAEADRIATERQRLDDERKAFEAQVAARAEAYRLEAIHAALAEAERLDAIAAKDKAEKEQLEAAKQAFEASDVAFKESLETLLSTIEADQKTCCAPDGICTDACSKTDVIDVSEPAPEPSDAAVMWEAIKGCCNAFGWTTEQAITRLAAVQWTI